MADSANPDWRTSTQVYELVKWFHDAHARQPDMTEARRIHEQITQEIAAALRREETCHRLEYTGSSYEGVKVRKNLEDPDLEFDVMVIMRGGKNMVSIPIAGKPGFVTLRKKVQNTTLEAMPVNADAYGNILASDTASAFFSKLQKIINGSSYMKGIVKLRMHGPAVQMDVSKNDVEYSVDMVPTYEVNGSMFVAKPLKGEVMEPSAWRRSFSLQEKEMFNSMDRDNGCRKQVMRVLKAIRNKEAGLNQLTSYHLKTALFREVTLRTNKEDWLYNRLGVRVLDVLKRIGDDLDRDEMQHFFDPDINLIGDMTQSSISNMRDRVRRLYSSETQFTRLLSL